MRNLIIYPIIIFLFLLSCTQKYETVDKLSKELIRTIKFKDFESFKNLGKEGGAFYLNAEIWFEDMQEQLVDNANSRGSKPDKIEYLRLRAERKRFIVYFTYEGRTEAQGKIEIYAGNTNEGWKIKDMSYRNEFK